MNYTPVFPTTTPIVDCDLTDEDTDLIDDLAAFAADINALLERQAQAQPIDLANLKATLKSLALGLGLTTEIIAAEKARWKQRGYREVLIPLDFEGAWQVFKAT